MIPSEESNTVLSRTKMCQAKVLALTSPLKVKAFLRSRLRAIARSMPSIILPIWVKMRRGLRNIYPNELLDSSIIVCAHPDDEVLWFSSILCQVDEIVICYLGMNYNLKCTNGRRRSLSQYPLKNIACLEIDQAEVFKHADWQDPIITEYGIQIPADFISSVKYKDNFSEIKKRLRNKLVGYRNVFTHNPWGEYGHEEHVQVYMAVKELQQELKFDLWFSNYCSDVSFHLMIKSILRCHRCYVTKKPDKMISIYLKELYKRNECWTWFNNWRCFSEESFIKGRVPSDEFEITGHLFPLNMIKRDVRM